MGEVGQLAVLVSGPQNPDTVMPNYLSINTDFPVLSSTETVTSSNGKTILAQSLRPLELARINASKKSDILHLCRIPGRPATMARSVARRALSLSVSIRTISAAAGSRGVSGPYYGRTPQLQQSLICPAISVRHVEHSTLRMRPGA